MWVSHDRRTGTAGRRRTGRGSQSSNARGKRDRKAALPTHLPQRVSVAWEGLARASRRLALCGALRDRGAGRARRRVRAWRCRRTSSLPRAGARRSSAPNHTAPRPVGALRSRRCQTPDALDTQCRGRHTFRSPIVILLSKPAHSFAVPRYSSWLPLARSTLAATSSICTR